MEFNRLIPELVVTDIEKTKLFYLGILGFNMEYERINEKFIFLSFEGSQMMFEEFNENGWNVDVLQHPFGRGINFSIEVKNIDELYQRVLDQNVKLYCIMTDKSYDVRGRTVKQCEFLVQDPDGYLLRFTHEENE